MKKDEIIKKLQKAKVSDLKWVDRAKSLVFDRKNETGISPIKREESEFWKWFSNEGEKLKKLSNNPPECMANIEKLHKEIYSRYFEIYQICFSKNKKRGFFSKIIGTRRLELTEEEKEKVESVFREMQDCAKRFIQEVERLERRVEAVSQEKIDFLM